MDFYENLDRILAEKHMSRRQMALQAGISESTISAAFRRRTAKFSAENIIKIASTLNVPIDQLIGKEAAADVFWQSFKDKKAEEVELPDEHSNSASIPAEERIRSSLMKLNREGQERVADYAEALEEAPRFRNPNYEEYRED